MLGDRAARPHAVTSQSSDAFWSTFAPSVQHQRAIDRVRRLPRPAAVALPSRRRAGRRTLASCVRLPRSAHPGGRGRRPCGSRRPHKRRRASGRRRRRLRRQVDRSATLIRCVRSSADTSGSTTSRTPTSTAVAASSKQEVARRSAPQSPPMTIAFRAASHAPVHGVEARDRSIQPGISARRDQDRREEHQRQADEVRRGDHRRLACARAARCRARGRRTPSRASARRHEDDEPAERAAVHADAEREADRSSKSAWSTA